MKMDKDKVKNIVKDTYGKIAQGQKTGCCEGTSSCGSDVSEFAKSIGYSEMN